MIWGSAYPGVKLGYSLFAIGGDDTAAKLVFAGCRFFSAGLIVLVGRWIFLTWNSRRRIEGQAVVQRQRLGCKDLLQLLILGLMQSGVHYFFFYIGLSIPPEPKARSSIRLQCFRGNSRTRVL